MPVLVLHSTQGATAAGAKATLEANNDRSHDILSPCEGGLVIPLLPHNEFARSLVNLSGGVETNNRGGVIQVEMVGFANRATAEYYQYYDSKYIVPEWGDLELGYVADYIISCHQNDGVPIVFPRPFLPYADSYGDNGVRLSFDEWLVVEGIIGHQHAPENCVVPDTMILKSDLTWCRASDLKTGDNLVGFDEENRELGSTGGRRFVKATAIVHGIVEKDCYRITLHDGRTVTASADHKWLVSLTAAKHGPRIAWVETKDLDPAKHELKDLGTPWEPLNTKESGWMAGAIDCDGSITMNNAGDAAVLFGQSDAYINVLKRFINYLDANKLDYYKINRFERSGFRASVGNAGFTDLRIKGGLWKTCKFLVEIGPSKFEAIREACWVGRVVGKTTGISTLSTIEHVGMCEVVSLESSSRTYVANGLLCHNTHGDPGALNIIRLQEIISSKLYREEDMLLITPATGIADGVFAFNGTHLRWIHSGIELQLLKRHGVTEWTDVSEAEMRAIIEATGKIGVAPNSGKYAGTW